MSSNMKFEVLENVIGVQEAAELWGMSADHVKKLARDRQIYAKLIGKTWVIDKYQDNPRKYNKKSMSSVHFEALKINVDVFKDFDFIQKPTFRVVENYEVESESYSVNVYFSMKINKKVKENEIECKYSSRFLLIDFLNGEVDESFNYDDLLGFDNTFIAHIESESIKTARRCRDKFIKQ